MALSGTNVRRVHYADGWGVPAELLAYARWGMPFSD